MTRPPAVKVALLSATCLAAQHNGWDDGLRTRTLAVVFDGLRPQPVG
ncbi:hypothetical protein ITP53_17695 [Nonomuraea sp. K274]|uniref:Uncharacterized protein n=1 Tax=Nonomuraea cypriaca TaxID=1187855 RepID=A0A931ABI4_9ACTN|nr:hypothetical protein [Nonomuraea cypriaca]MBF8187533.1 hypothetical protein [Nonomuraea cypriaca]